MTHQIITKLQELNLELPQGAAPAAAYVPYVVTGNQVIVSGQLPMKDGAPQFIGKVGADYGVDEAKQAAVLCLLNVLAHVGAACGGDWNKVKRCVRLGVFVNSTPEFTDQPLVANGASELIKELLGDAGIHARAAVGVTQLPKGVAVEIEAQFEIS